MAEGNLSTRRYIGRHRRLSLPHFPTPLSILLLTVGTSFTCVRSQTGAIQIRVSDELTECVPSNITWTGGSPPYTLGISVGNFNHGPDQEYSNLSTTFFVWSTDVPAENFVQFAVGDGLAIAYSGDVDINAGLTQSCLPQPLDPFTSSSGSSSPTTKTQGAPPSNSSMSLPPSTSIASTTVTVSVAVTGSAGGMNTAAPGATTSSSTSSSHSSSLSPDVIGIIAAVAVVIAAAVIGILYRRYTRSHADPAGNSNASTSTPPFAGPVPPTSPTVRATSIMSAASPNYSPVMSPPEGALHFAPYGHGHGPAPHRPAWQSAASIRTTHTQTYIVGPGSPPAALPYEPPGTGLPGGWDAHETHLGQTQWRQEGVVAAPVEQGRLLTTPDPTPNPNQNPNPDVGHAYGGGTVASEGGSLGGYALLQRP